MSVRPGIQLSQGHCSHATCDRRFHLNHEFAIAGAAAPRCRSMGHFKAPAWISGSIRQRRIWRRGGRNRPGRPYRVCSNGLMRSVMLRRLFQEECVPKHEGGCRPHIRCFHASNVDQQRPEKSLRQAGKDGFVLPTGRILDKISGWGWKAPICLISLAITRLTAWDSVNSFGFIAHENIVPVECFGYRHRVVSRTGIKNKKML